MFQSLEPITMTKEEYFDIPIVSELKKVGDRHRIQSDKFDPIEKGFGGLVEVIKTNYDTKSEDDILEVRIGVRKVNFI